MSGPRSSRWLMVAAVLIPGCGVEPPEARPMPPAAAAPDKATLFGDPGLVPTRHGERARRELGLAETITTAAAMLPEVARVRADVELPPRDDPEPPRVLIVVHRSAAPESSALRARLERIARQVVSPSASVELIVTPGRAEPVEPAPRRLAWPLALGLLGLGFFAGLLVERARRLGRGFARPWARARRP